MALRSTTLVTMDALKTWCNVTPGGAKSVTSIERSGTTATAVILNHGWRMLDTAVFAGANQSAYNGAQTISVVDANTVTFPVAGSPATPATGTITARSDNDAILARIGDRVSEQLERATRRIYRQRSAAQTLNGHGRAALYLEYFPIIGTPTVTIDGTTEDASLYVVEASRGCLRRKNTGDTWPVGVGNIVVNYDAGYADDDLPADVVGLALDVAKFLYERRDKPMVASAVTVGPSNVSLIAGLPIDLRNQIAQLCDTRFG